MAIDAEPEASGPLVLSLASGSRLGEYVIDGLLGAGGMGQVFAARRLDDGQPIAIKHFPCTDPAQLFRFKREFRALADVRHDNLIALGELTVLRDGRAYFTMERIVGRPFVEWVRRELPIGVPPNLARLRRAMRQLIAGTEHLHRAGFVHRDLKPSNVLITTEGRVVILDFGLIREFASAGQTWTREGQTIGTPNYMAPEQIANESISPAADWYSVGVMLFECLTGRRPFLGTAVEVMMAKLDERVGNPADALADLPAPIIELCRQLLASEPSDRPSGAELLACFGEQPNPDAPVARVREPTRRAPSFVGRRGDLVRLRNAYTEMRAGATVSVHLHALEGLGKTALVEQFLLELEAGSEHVILRGRCHERESVPYKGIDSLVDALSLHLRHMSDVDAASLQPRHLGPLARLFPVLADVWSHRGRAAPDGDPIELRRLGTAALREVLTRIGDQSPLVLWIDDFHWADADSVRLLDQLLRPPDSPSLLLILGSRTRELENAVSWIATQEQVGRKVHEIELGPLTRELAHTLARALAPHASPTLLDSLVEQANGNPFALVQLTHDRESTLREPDYGLARRILALGKSTRYVLSALAVAGRPLARTVLTDLRPGADGELARLAELGLVVVDEQSASIEAAQLREIVIAELSTAELRELHGRLGELLVAHGIESEALVDHFEQAGQRERAAQLAIATADQAALALAFDRAAAGYRRALRLAPADTPSGEVDVLRRQLADQLVHLGRTTEAAQLLLEISHRLPRPVAHELRGRAARLLIFGRRIDEAMPLLAEQLAVVGERLPRRKLAVLAMTAWNRLILALRGHQYTLRPPQKIDTRQIDRLEALSNVAMALVSAASQSATGPQIYALRSRALRLALKVGDARCLASILATEALLSATLGHGERGDSLIADAKRLSRSLDDPELECEVDCIQASIHFYSFRWTTAAAAFAELAHRIEDSSRGGGGLVRALVLRSSAHLRVLCGDIAEVRRRAPGDASTLRELGNEIEMTEHALKAALVHLYDGEFELARAVLNGFETQSKSTPPVFTFRNISIARLAVEIALFTGDLAHALETIESTILQTRRYFIYAMPVIDLQLEELRARCLTLALIAKPEDRRIRRRIRQSTRRLSHSRLPMFEAAAANAEAAVHELDGRSDAALVARSRALDGFERAGMRAHRAAASLRIAVITRDPPLADAGSKYFATEGIVGWRRVVEIIAPSPTAV